MNLSQRLSNSILASIGFVLVLWCVKSAEILFSIDTHFFAVYPQSIDGLLGIVTAPLIHGSLDHIFSNTLPLLVLLTALLYGYPKSALRVLVSVWLLSGAGVWLFAREAHHLGASGITHGVFFYLLVVGILRRDKSSVGIMMIAFFMYGGMTMSIFPREPGISFEYHLFGGGSGVLLALLWYRLDPKPDVQYYPWERRTADEDKGGNGHENSDEDDPIIGDAWRTEQQEAQQPHQQDNGLITDDIDPDNDVSNTENASNLSSDPPPKVIHIARRD